MDGAREFDLPLDVDDFALSQPDTSRYAAGAAERKVPELIDRQAVDLADLGALGVQEDRAFFDLVLHPFPIAVDPKNGCIDCFLHVFGLNQFAACLRCPIVRLFEEIDDAAHQQRHLLRVLGRAGTLLDDPTDRFAIKGVQILFPNKL